MGRLLGILTVAAAILVAKYGGRFHGQTAAGAQPAGQPSSTPEIKPAPPTPIAIKKEELGDGDPWNPDWDKIVEEALPPELLSSSRQRQVKALCPRFISMSEADRRAFWAYFFQALAGAEAGLRPTADVRHTDPEVAVIDPVTHRVTRQEGLLQLKYLDSKRYGCDFDWEKDKELPEHDPEKTILQPRNNLECGVRILTNQLVAQHKPVLSSTSYWVTLRPRTTSFAVFKKQLGNLPAACGPSPYRRAGLPAETQAQVPEARSQSLNPGQAGEPGATRQH